MVKATFFSADDRLVASTDLGCLYLAFAMLTGLFYWVVLQTNVYNTMGIVLRPCWAAGVREEKAYTWRMKEGRRILNKRQRELVIYLECAKALAKGSLVAHRQTHNGISKGGLGQVDNKEATGEGRSFNKRQQELVIYPE